MPTFLNKILGVFSATAGTEPGESGIDFAEISSSEFATFSVTPNATENAGDERKRFIFIAQNTGTGPTNSHFSIFLSDALPNSPKVFKVFTNPEEAVVCATAVALYEQLEPFVEIISSNQRSRPFFSSASTVRDFVMSALTHPEWTAAHIMASSSSIKFVDPKSLYPKSAIHHKLNTRSGKEGLTPLMVAFDCHNQAFVQEAVGANGLLRDVVDFTLSDSNGRNYLYYAVTYHCNVFPTTDPERDKELFLVKIVGAYPEGAREVDSEGRSPLHLAIAAKRLDVLKFLVNHCSGALEHNPKAAASLLHIAAEVGQTEMVQFLLERAPELVLLKDSKHAATALHWATSIEVVDALLDAGCDPDELSSTGETAIHVALRYDRQPVVAALIAFAAKLDVVAPGIGAPLHMVSGCNKPSKTVVEMLIAYDCDLDVLSADGHTARHLAAVGAQPPPEVDPSEQPTSVRLTNALYSILQREDELKKKRDECENVVALLNTVGAVRCPPGKEGCAPGCASAGTFNGTMPTGFATFPIVERKGNDCPASDLVDRLLSDTAVAEVEANPHLYRDRLRVLSLDGGGVRGLMTTMMMRHLERLVGLPIVDCFDFIAGTSVGGLIALFLLYGRPYGPKFAPCGRNPLVNMQRLAYEMRRKVFVGSRPYSTTALEALLKKAFGEETLLSSASDPMIMVTSVQADLFPAELLMFRNYSSAIELYEQAHPELVAPRPESPVKPVVSPATSMAALLASGADDPIKASASATNVARSVSPGPSLETVAGSPQKSTANSPMVASPTEDRGLVWRAARATGAAPTYFRAFGHFIDGGVMANNPTLDALTDLHQLAKVSRALGFGDDMAERFRVGLVLSVGTGREMQRETAVADLRRPEGIMDSVALGRSLFAFINLLIDQATVADGRPVDRSRAWCAQMNAMFYRLSPIFSSHVELDEHDETLLVRALYETRAYLHSNADQMAQLASVLRRLAEARRSHHMGNMAAMEQ